MNTDVVPLSLGDIEASPGPDAVCSQLPGRLYPQARHHNQYRHHLLLRSSTNHYVSQTTDVRDHQLHPLRKHTETYQRLSATF